MDYEDEKYNGSTDTPPSMSITAKDLEDGSLLKAAVNTFNRERTKGHFIDILGLLRDSLVWIPCSPILSERDQAALVALANEAEGDADALVGKTFTPQDDIRMVPDILQQGEKYFFPVFSSVDEMGKYGEGFSKVQKHMLEAVSLAMNNEKNVTGIVLNAFSEPFIIDKELFDVLRNMKSGIVSS